MTSNARGSESNVSSVAPNFNKDMEDAYKSWLDHAKDLETGTPEREAALTPFINDFMSSRGWKLKTGSTFLFEIRI